MYRETIKDVENFKSEEFKGLKEKDEELLYGTRNSDAVMGVQNFLNENGYTDQNDEKLTVNGRYEANTANAVIKYQKDNNLTVDGIVGDETWDSMYNKKKKKEENDSFAEGLKTKSGGWFYDRIQSIRKAQHDLGITPSGKIDEENESSAEDDFHGRVRRQWERGKNTDVWNAPKVEKYPYEEGTGQEIWGRNVPKRERMPWEAIGEIQGRNIPDKAVKPDSGRAPDAQAKPWQRNVPDSKGQMPWGSYVPRERNPRDINTRQGRNAYDESKTTAFFPSDYNLQNFPPYIKNALAYTDKTGETGAKVQPLAGGVRTPGINAHLNFIPDYAMKKLEKKAEAENPYILPLSERADEASGEYEPTDEYLSDTKSEEKEETNWLWDYIRNPKETVIRFAKEAGKTIDEAQKELQRNVWQLGAEIVLKDWKKCPVSQFMLEHSLQDNPTSMTLGNESDIAELIKKDPVYLNALDKAIEESDGKTIDTDLEDIAFKTPDLYYSIHRATIHVKGYKNGEGKWIITAMLEDTYNFTEWMTLSVNEEGEWTINVSTGTVANDVAKISQSTGAINPYMVRVYFNTIR